MWRTGKRRSQSDHRDKAGTAALDLHQAPPNSSVAHRTTRLAVPPQSGLVSLGGPKNP
jgi:hypothetical protein